MKEYKEDSWLKQYWRPAVAWQYFIVCLFDFIVFPAASMALHNQPWDPLTLKESGFYHLSMSAIIGVAAWTRGQEKIKRLFLGDSTEEEVVVETTTQKPTRNK
jgi:hypothetical protein